MKNLFLFISLIVFITTVVIFSCNHDPFIPKHDVCFESEIFPLLRTNCTMSGCHDVATKKEGYSFTDYNSILAGVVAGKPGESPIYKAISANSDEQMPPGNQMDAYQIGDIKLWIGQGAKNTANCSVCDTAVYSYSFTIAPAFELYCSGCHNINTYIKFGDTIKLGSYDDIKAYLDTNFFNQFAFDSAINYNNSDLKKRMPPSGKLSDCQVKQILKWYMDGYPNN